MSGLNEALGAQRMPGLSAEQVQTSRKLLKDPNHLVRKGIRIESASVDAGNTGQTYKLRAGLALVRVIAGQHAGKYVQPTHASAPASGDVEDAVILLEDVDMRAKAGDGTKEDQQASGLVHGFVYDDACIFVGSGYEAAIKAVLKQVHFHVEL